MLIHGNNPVRRKGPDHVLPDPDLAEEFALVVAAPWKVDPPRFNIPSSAHSSSGLLPGHHPPAVSAWNAELLTDVNVCCRNSKRRARASILAAGCVR
jgi:hypothetical protein